MSPSTKIFSIFAVVFLLALSLGINLINLQFAKFTVFISVFYLFIVSIKTSERLWSAFFIIAAIIFNPIQGIFKLPVIYWKSLDIFVALGILLFFYRYYDGYRKGSDFEKFISSLFPREEWVIEDWTKDKSKRLRREVESDMNPDLTIRNLKTGKRFAIECKFRSRPWINNGITGIFWKAYNHDFYKKYGNRENVSVNVVFGLGGNAKSPKRIFLIPLEKLENYKGKVIPLHYLESFEKSIKAQLVF